MFQVKNSLRSQDRFLFQLIVIFISLTLLYFSFVGKVHASGSAFSGEAIWHTYFAPDDEIPMTGDFDCNGFKDDIITFTNDGNADVWVALNTGWGSDHFGTASKWHDYFAPTGEVPMVGDFNSDGCDDIITFTMFGSATCSMFSKGAANVAIG